ncbi:MAG: hypothetical protein ABIS50_02095 [Luteolibacter sp.]|uniref:hypothetical protein n=1 Tax=Luteolibacter sp. TaxID=1962973 RepID=UPI003264C4FC
MMDLAVWSHAGISSEILDGDAMIEANQVKVPMAENSAGLMDLRVAHSQWVGRSAN